MTTATATKPAPAYLSLATKAPTGQPMVKWFSFRTRTDGRVRVQSWVEYTDAHGRPASGCGDDITQTAPKARDTYRWALSQGYAVATR